MAKSKRGSNPFYAIVVFLGIAFSVTACAYGVMAFRALRGRDDAGVKSALLEFLDQHGEKLLIAEVLLLGLATFGAIKTDNYWQSRASEPDQS
ncbi:MAG: hypothetical protein JNM18_18550 [Planctomycetaceae bacterium]|nr:hypothetical protein [Planctomycetaceae bacterium]